MGGIHVCRLFLVADDDSDSDSDDNDDDDVHTIMPLHLISNYSLP